MNEVYNSSNTIKLYPNPNAGTMNIEYRIEQDGILNLADASGRTVCSKKLLANQQIATIDCAQMVNGMYIYKITIADQIVATGKVVINK
jgi:hypothetical protein